MSKAEKAGELFEMGYNCAQSVACAFQNEVGLTEGDILRATAAMGGGVSKMREVCGCVLGIAFVLGAVEGTFPAKDRESKGRLYGNVQNLADLFKAEYGSVVCAELLGIKRDGSSMPSERNAEYKKRPCKEMVMKAAEILDTYFKEKES